eukprot:TRINITY_DN24751_c0_g1_i1.p1 TRINITY_DN24751_c0_g1~~TRINITY_DN24751_c0_g1_i1.p1  ORF type:complete len:356 (+),score=79.23 TRINITY_DN24751_c0_g1_i1:192-1259(+)
MAQAELDRPMGKSDRPRTTGELMRSMRKLGDYDLEVEGDNDVAFGSLEERALYEELQAKGKGHAIFERAGPFWQMACLRAKKYNIERAYELIINYFKWRESFGVDTTTVDNDSEYRALVERGVVEACGNVDKQGRYVLTVRQSRTDPGRWSPRYAVLATHAALESLLVRFPQSQAHGVSFVNDMSGIKMANMDSRVPREMFAAFSSKLPVRFGGLYVVHPPLFMRMIAPVIRMFMSKKMQSRCKILSKGYPELQQHLELDQLPTDFGGSYAYQHSDYVEFVSQMQSDYGKKRNLEGQVESAMQSRAAGYLDALNNSDEEQFHDCSDVDIHSMRSVTISCGSSTGWSLECDNLASV